MCVTAFSIYQEKAPSLCCLVNHIYLKNLSMVLVRLWQIKFSVDWIIFQFLLKPALSQPFQPSNLDDQRLASSLEISAFDIFGGQIFSSLVETEV